MTKLSIIILNFNTKGMVIDCVNTLLTQYLKELESGEFEIVVADNASSDDSVQVIKNAFKNQKHIRVIENGENYGFGKGNNKASVHAKGHYLLFLNSDTEVLDTGLRGMIAYMETHPKVGIFGGRLLNTKGTPQKSAGKFYTLINFFLMLLGLERFGLLRSSPTDIQSVDWVSGASMMVGAQTFQKLGGFDEQIFMYMEDMEICFRAKKQGILTYFYPHITIKHQEHGSSNRTFAIVNIYKGILYFYKKYKPQWQYNLVRFALSTKAILLFTLGKILHNIYLTQTYEKASTISR